MDERGGPDPTRTRVEVDAPLRRARRPAAVLENGAPRHGPPNPPTLGAPMLSRWRSSILHQAPSVWEVASTPPRSALEGEARQGRVGATPWAPRRGARTARGTRPRASSHHRAAPLGGIPRCPGAWPDPRWARS